MTVTTLRPFHRVAFALLVMTGRVTLLGLSRWAGPGGSDRTGQRFFSTVLPWATLLWVFVRPHLYRPGDVYLWAGDAVVVTNAGHHPHGRERFVARLYGQPVPGLVFCPVALVSTQARRALPGHVEQVVRSDAEKAASQAQAAAKPPKPATDKRRRGRPQGRQNNNTADVTFTPAWGQSNSMITAWRQRVAAASSVTSRVLAGPWGHHHAVHMARQGHVPLLSTRRSDSAWYWPSTGLDAGRGPHRLDGSPLDDRSMPETVRNATTVDGHLQTRVSQLQRRHQECSPARHVVIIVQRTRQTHAWAQAILCSRDLNRPDALWRDDSCLRFQLEFNGRAATQDGGLEDCMTVTQTAVTKAANLALCMGNVSPRLLGDVRQRDPASGILDLKAPCRGYTYVPETRKMLPEKPAPV